jgi:uncharacterized protein (TIRG00374 family)
MVLVASQPESPRNRFTALYWIVSLGLAVGLLYYSLRGVDWRAVGTILATARLPWVGLTILVGTTATFVRSLRWRLLLTAEAPVSPTTAFWATNIGYFGNNYLPARAGEFMRTYMVSAGSTLSKAYILTTALAERVSDGIALICIAAVVLLTIRNRPGWLAHASRPFAILGLLGVVCIVVLPRLEPFWRTILGKLPLPEGLRSKLEGILGQILLGLRSFHDAGRLSRFILLTATIWCLDASTTMITARALGMNVSLPVAFLLNAGLGLGSALPATPGYVGIYQFVAISILVPFGFSRTQALAYILFVQAIQYVGTAAWGLFALSYYRSLRTRVSASLAVPDRTPA